MNPDLEKFADEVLAVDEAVLGKGLDWPELSETPGISGRKYWITDLREWHRMRRGEIPYFTAQLVVDDASRWAGVTTKHS